jgi:hypothetical protein
MVLGANTYRQFVELLGASAEADKLDRVERPDEEPVADGGVEHAGGPLDWPGSTVESGDVIDIVARLKQESEVPLRSHGSLSPNHALVVADLVDRVQADAGVVPGHAAAGATCGSCSKLRQPTKPLRQMPVAVAEELHRRRQQR